MSTRTTARSADRRHGREPEIKPFDFRRPSTLSREHIRAMQIVQDNMARGLTTVFAGALRAVATVTVRDLARVLPSLWQQEIRKGRTWMWPEFLSSVRDPQSGSVTAAAAFCLIVCSTWPS